MEVAAFKVVVVLLSILFEIGLVKGSNITHSRLFGNSTMGDLERVLRETFDDYVYVLSTGNYRDDRCFKVLPANVLGIHAIINETGVRVSQTINPRCIDHPTEEWLRRNPICMYSYFNTTEYVNFNCTSKMAYCQRCHKCLVTTKRHPTTIQMFRSPYTCTNAVYDNPWEAEFFLNKTGRRSVNATIDTYVSDVENTVRALERMYNECVRNAPASCARRPDFCRRFVPSCRETLIEVTSLPTIPPSTTNTECPVCPPTSCRPSLAKCRHECYAVPSASYYRTNVCACTIYQGTLV